MKNIYKIITVSLILAIALFISTPVQADPPGMPGDHGTDGDVPGGGAPIGSGVILLVAMASAYGSKKAFDLKA